MLLSQLPYELITHIGSFLHISDLVNFATTCSYLHACAEDRLVIHQHKLASLSVLSDANRPRTTETLRNIFFEDASHRDAWYPRKVIVHAYEWSVFNGQPHKMSEAILSDGRSFDMLMAISELHQPRIDTFIEDIEWSNDCFEGFLTLALLRMPRLSSLHFSLHPCHGYSRVFSSTGYNQPSLTLPHAHTFSVFTSAIETIGRGGMTTIWPPGLRSLRSIEIDIDNLHAFNSFDFGRTPSVPRLRLDDFYPFFRLPNLRRLKISRHPSIQPHSARRWPRAMKFVGSQNGSSIEELILIGFSGWQEYVHRMVQSVRSLRTLVLCYRSQESELENVIKALGSLHESSLETFVLPPHTSNALSWCQSFLRLKYITISYVEVMANFHKHQHDPRSNDLGRENTSFQLASILPEALEFLVLIGGRQLSTVTSVRAIPLYNDIQKFLDVILTFISARGHTPKAKASTSHARNLRDVCFGDMRVAVVPQDKAVGKTLHQSYTKAKEIARLKLSHEINKSERLKDTCENHKVTLHVMDLKSRVCNHGYRHPYTPGRRMTRQELLDLADRLSENADLTTQAVLTRYTENIPKNYRP